MSKRIAFAIFLLCIGMVYGCARAVPMVTPVTTTPEPIDVDIMAGLGWEWVLEDVVFGVVDGCICGEPRDDGRVCDVYVEIVTDIMAEVWTDVSPEQLEGIVGVEWAEGRALGRDPRYSWETILDGICALARAEFYGDATCRYTWPSGNIDVDCCANFADGLELEVVGRSEFCP